MPTPKKQNGAKPQQKKPKNKAKKVKMPKMSPVGKSNGNRDYMVGTLSSGGTGPGLNGPLGQNKCRVNFVHQLSSEKYDYAAPGWIASVADNGAVTSDGNGKAATRFVIAPTVLAIRNATFLTLYELVHIQSVILRWIPNASVATAGSIIACCDYNGAIGSFPTTLTGAAQRESMTRHMVWQAFNHNLKWRDNVDRTAVVSSSSSTSHRPDGLAYHIGLVIDGAPANTLLGYLEIQTVYVYTGLKATSE